MGKIISLNTGKYDILFEANDNFEEEGLQQVGVVEEIEKNLDKALGIITPFCNSLLKKFDQITRKP